MHLPIAEETAGADAGADDVDAGVVLPELLPPQPVASTAASTSGPSMPSGAIRAIMVRLVMVNDISLAYAADRRSVPGSACSRAGGGDRCALAHRR